MYVLKFKVVWAEHPTMHEFSLTHAGDEGLKGIAHKV